MDTQKEELNKMPDSPTDESSASAPGFLSRSLESYIEFERRWSEVLANFLTRSFGTLRFLNIILLLSLLWVLINLDLIPGLDPFDPYPFGWLMMVVQIFAIVLSIIVLISQNREERINEVYQKMDFEINVRAEREITKILHMLEEVHRELGIDKVDKELEKMKLKTDISKLKKNVEKIIEENNNINDVI
jgi:uncharacterized membrane protein